VPDTPLDPRVFGVLTALEADSPGFLSELIDDFETGAVRRLEALHAAILSGDRVALAFAAHSLRGSCGTLGALRMARTAARLEDEPMPLTAAASLVSGLNREYARVRRALDEAGRASAATERRPHYHAPGAIRFEQAATEGARPA
jgi:HPt (histidine-containing phosphotransfer) domain-containing protein